MYNWYKDHIKQKSDFKHVQNVQIQIILHMHKVPSRPLLSIHIEGWAQDYGNSNIFLKPLFRGNLDPFVNNANLGAIAHTSNGT